MANNTLKPSKKNKTTSKAEKGRKLAELIEEIRDAESQINGIADDLWTFSKLKPIKAMIDALQGAAEQISDALDDLDA